MVKQASWPGRNGRCDACGSAGWSDAGFAHCRRINLACRSRHRTCPGSPGSISGPQPARLRLCSRPVAFDFTHCGRTDLAGRRPLESLEPLRAAEFGSSTLSGAGDSILRLVSSVGAPSARRRAIGDLPPRLQRRFPSRLVAPRLGLRSSRAVCRRLQPAETPRRIAVWGAASPLLPRRCNWRRMPIPINPASAIPAIVGQNQRESGGSASGTGSGGGTMCQPMPFADSERGARTAAAAAGRGQASFALQR